ncbi:carbonic anhydrase [Anabaena cylindrica UHCC 0172]|uniref:carbonic anhydrase n=1 Tax=Anabaena cylindrica TaxID=1165 RepID=UPI002B2218FD|nr:carbonic anhydrase [Anabaena cylindrica]MEA5550501.1 carbonic anhydrase [Anabaena cylindrica UHCC 0172]
MSSKQQKNYLSRRNLLQLGTGVIGAGVALSVASNVVTPEVATAQNITTPDEALKALLDGNNRFANRKRRYGNQSYSRLLEVAKGQKPFASILGCADSRVPSEIIFDQGLGDLFVCRVAGNIAIPEGIGSLEYGSLVLGAKVILVLGHERCGAVTATLKGEEVPGQIGKLIEAIKPGVEKSKGQPGDKLENASKANILVQIENLKTSQVLSELINANKLKIVGGYYDLDTGIVSLVS